MRNAMASNEDKVREVNIKRFKELHHQIVRQQQDEEEYKRLLGSLKEEIIAKPETLKEEEEVELRYFFSKDAKKELVELLKDYHNEFKKEPSPHNNGFALTFTSRQGAVNFFKSQFEKGRAFNMTCTNEDQRFYSDGKDIFVQGTHAQVTDYLKNKENYEVGEDGTLTPIEGLEHRNGPSF